MKTKLQTLRELKGLSIQELALKASKVCACGCVGHMELTIKYIESGIPLCPKPRKTYEWKALAKALDCKNGDIYLKV
ncbi:hypothetical protein [Listeria fleischmannii]|uniref:HTH cro/C1-type domain-containing protein n=1 Tax=Listeria fleischmannii FSL S10-1203 TaxID=1265822 RepID=W7DT22_9LIST|nr:hypothetical protein [Listeria fleischmannii]EUJ56434.1 hypothetical protein MCOL2_08966 [Listeria fleischmannii FSL S10-1203]